MSTNTPADVTLQHPQLSDDLLLSQAKSGDQQAFGELCLRYNGILKRKIFSIVRHYEDTEDVLQDTFLSAYKHLHAFRETCKFSTWLIQIGIEAQATWAL
jgi:RNA polymerase sigma-70 factor (ECF subfamily)